MSDIEKAIDYFSECLELCNKNKIKIFISMAIPALEKQIPLKAIETVQAIRACPICKYPANNKYCPNCGQRILEEMGK